MYEKMKYCMFIGWIQCHRWLSALQKWWCNMRVSNAHMFYSRMTLSSNLIIVYYCTTLHNRWWIKPKWNINVKMLSSNKLWYNWTIKPCNLKQYSHLKHAYFLQLHGIHLLIGSLLLKCRHFINPYTFQHCRFSVLYAKRKKTTCQNVIKVYEIH